MREFELALHPDKTRLIRFGRHAAKQREKLGEGKPETFDFLGFTHFCTRSRKWGSFVIGRKTIKKRMRAKLQAIKMELRRLMHDPIAKTGAWVKQMLKGHLNYFAVSGNHPSLWWFFNKVKRLWLASLKRRSQTARLNWERFIQLIDRFFPPIRTTTPVALSPLRRQNPREEPGALAAHAGICAGGGWQWPSLPRPSGPAGNRDQLLLTRYGRRRGRGFRTVRGVLPDLGPGLAPAQESHHASLYEQACRRQQFHLGAVGFSIVRVVDAASP